jgi:prepilin-type N-terminal cleavage/methylation domain-containing protein
MNNTVRSDTGRRRNKQRGFSLVEMLSVIATMGALATISIQTFVVYKAEGYYSNSESGMRNAKLALEAGLVNEDRFPANRVLWTVSDTPGRVTVNDAALIAPGLNNNPNSYIYVYHNTGCVGGGWCLSDWITSRHCGSKEYTYWYRYANGYEQMVSHVDTAGWTC